MMRVGGISPETLRARMATSGLGLAIPPITIRLRSPLRFLADQIHALYADYELVDASEYADADLRLVPVAGIRRWLRSQVQFVVDGVAPFEPFPADHALPLFEWGLNWVFVNRMHSYLLLHAAAVERNGRAVLFPAWPGSGKSTLAASLASRGWRFLSDEFGIVTLDGASILPFTRPIPLKNQSIGVMRAFDPHAFLGPVFPKTRKGDVAHFRAPSTSVQRGNEPAQIGAIVFPDFQSGSVVEVLPLGRATSFLKLAGNSFNYEVVGERGFRAVASIVERCDSHILRYGSLEDAHAALDTLLCEAIPA